MGTPTAIAAYVALFAATGFLFLFANLLLGWLVRPRLPNREKLDVYECGEPAIGSSFVQFDLRFYVVALLFLIFDVEVAFFFPWATVFGKSTALMDERLTPAAAEQVFHEMGVRNPDRDLIGADPAPRVEEARKLALISLADIGLFFAILLVGFAYVWRRGDLDWVRAVADERAKAVAERPMLA